MEIIRLSPGEIAPPEADCIRLHQLDAGRVRLEGSALFEGTSVTIGNSIYPSEQEAEAAGIAWADECDISTLYVARLGAEEMDGE